MQLSHNKTFSSSWLSPPIIFGFILFYLSSAQANINCEQAVSYFQQSNIAKTESQEKELLTLSLDLCTSYADAHNNMGVLLESHGQLNQALSHYKKAVATNPNSLEAWYGIGDVYRKQKQLPLALEAYLKICSKDEDAKNHVQKLITNNRYKITESDDILETESLLIIYDKNRQEKIKTALNNCGIKITHKSASRPKATFRSLSFSSGSAILKSSSEKQLHKLSTALLNLSPNKVRIIGHTDKQLYKGKNNTQSKALNKQLSKNRAESIKQYLVNLGIPKESLITIGVGSTQLLDGNNTIIAHKKNRRVEIEFIK